MSFFRLIGASTFANRCFLRMSARRVLSREGARVRGTTGVLLFV